MLHMLQGGPRLIFLSFLHACSLARTKTHTHTPMHVGRSCPERTSSSMGSDAISDCICDLGYSLFVNTSDENRTLCVACEVGKYKRVMGSSDCVACFGNATSPEASQSASDCLCTAGFTSSLKSSSNCSVCPLGTYKDFVGSEPCIPVYMKCVHTAEIQPACNCRLQKPAGGKLCLFAVRKALERICRTALFLLENTWF
jgi:hypothetical protein